jgi:hypothetical protein
MFLREFATNYNIVSNRKKCFFHKNRINVFLLIKLIPTTDDCTLFDLVDYSVQMADAKVRKTVESHVLRYLENTFGEIKKFRNLSANLI